MSRSYSVVVPAFNAAPTLADCLASVAAQTLPPRQVLVIDDCSRDGTGAEAERFRETFAARGIDFEYLRMSRNGGPSKARNAGIRAATQDRVAFIDADDVWATRKLEIVDRFFAKTQAALICHSYTEAAAFEPTAQGYEAVPLSVCGLMLRNPASTSCAVMRKSTGLEFDEHMRYCEDYDLWMRTAESHRVVRLVGQPLTRLGRPQLSAGGLSSNTWGMRGGELRVYYKLCSRAWFARGWMLPGLVVLSVLKHTYSWLRRGQRLRRGGPA